MKRSLAILLVFMYMGLTAKTFVREYTYNASDADSKLSSRAIAMEQVKRLLLEEVGVYIQSSIIHKESEQDGVLSSLSQKEIQVLSAGITQSKIIAEKWDGERYYLKAQIVLDEDDVLMKLDELINDSRKQQNIQENRLMTDAAIAQIDSLRSALFREQDINKQLLIQQSYQSEAAKLSAVEYYEEAQRMSSTDDTYMENMQDMIKLYQKSVEADSTFGKAWLELGILHLFADNPGMAKIALSNAWLYTSDPYALLWLGDAYKKTNDFKEAFATYRKCADEYRNYQMPDYGDTDPESLKSIQEHNQSQKMQPLNRIAEMHYTFGDKEKALEAYQEVIQQDPNNITAMIYVSSIFTDLGRFEEAAAIYFNMIKMDRMPLSTIYNNIARINVEKRDFETAIMYFQLAIDNEEDPRFSINTKSDIAHCYYLSGDNAKAISIYAEISKANPNELYYIYMLGICYAASGDNVNAKKHHIIAAKKGFEASQSWCKDNAVSY